MVLFPNAAEPSMRIFLMTLVIAAAVASCAPDGTTLVGETGGVDHSCHSNPKDSQGSGCDHRHHFF